MKVFVRHSASISKFKWFEQPCSLSFLNVEATASLRMCFCQTNSTKVVQSRAIKMRRLWTKRDFVARNTYLKFPQIFTTRAVNICDKHKAKRCFWVSLDMLGEINFQSKLYLRASIFFVWKLSSRQKRRLKVVGHSENFWGWGQKPLVTDLCHKHLATWLL